MSVKFGINPISWNNDDLRSLGENIPLEQCLSEAKQAGYDGLELGHKFPRQADALSAVMAPHGLDVVSGWYSGELLTRSVEEEIEAVQDHLALLKAVGSDVMVWAEVTGCIHGDLDVPLSKRPVMGEDQWVDFAEKLTRMGEYLASQGMKLAFHHHMGTVIETEAEVDRMMSMTGPDVWLLVDTGHMTFAGGDPYALIERYGSRIAHVHCKDIRPDILAEARRQDWSFLAAVVQGVFTVPGDGSIDYQRVADLLSASGYQGWMVVEAEQDPEKANPLEYASMGYQHLKSVTSQAGLA